MYISFDTMAKTKTHELADDSDGMFSQENFWENPEKHLIATLLQRAVSDLHEHISIIDRINAIDWFLYPLPERQDCWNFFQVCEILDISDYRINILIKKASVALLEVTEEKQIKKDTAVPQQKRKRHDSRN